MCKPTINSLQNGKYKVNSLVGSGGFGNTYLATQVALSRKVAIKEFFMRDFCERDESTSHVVVPTEHSREIVEKYKQKFLKEAQMIASLKNEHIIQIYDIFEENNTAYYVMQYMDGGSLKDKIENDGPLSEEAAVRYILQVADALSHLHSKNILHLDVKPANILLDEKDSPILIDFGISKRYDEDGGQTSTTPAGISKGYAPIEQYQQGSMSNFSPASDVYSLGATLFYLLTGQTPPDAMEITNEGLDQKFLSRFSANIRSSVNAAMQARRKDRPQTIEEFTVLLNQTVVEEETTVVIDIKKPEVKEVKRETKQVKTSKRIPKWVFALPVLAVLIGALLLWFSKHESGVPDNGEDEINLVSDLQLDSVNYYIGVNLGSFIKSNNFAESLDELNWTEIQSGIKDFINAKGSPYDADFSKQFKIDINEMSGILNKYLENRKAGMVVDVKSTSYLIGVNIGSFIKGQGFFKSMAELNNKMIRSGAKDFLEGELTINIDNMNDFLARRIEEVKAYTAAVNKAEEEDFLKKNAGRAGVKTTASGLQYKIIREGGSNKVGPQDTVIVNYTGKLIDGTVFDENHNIQFAANHVIKGWTEGLGLIGEGGKVTLYIPSELAYGKKEVGEIKPYSLLIFDVEVLKVKRKR